MSAPNVNIAIVTYNRLDLTKICLEALFAKTRGNFTANIVDNGSSDGTPEYLEQLAAGESRARVTFLGANRGLTVGRNQAWDSQPADYYAVMDNDIRVHDPDWLLKLTAFLDRNPEVGMAAYHLANWSHRYQEMTLPSGDRFVDSDLCNGGCAMIRRREFEAFGFWNEDYGKYGLEDMDYCLRLALKDFRVGYLGLRSGEVEHMGYDEEFWDDERETKKIAVVKRQYQGERMYNINRFLFSQGIRPLHVPRKYLPHRTVDGVIKFKINPAYLPISKLQSDFAQQVGFSADENNTYLDLSKYKDQPE